MSDKETKIKVLHIQQWKDEHISVVAIEQGKLNDWTLLTSDRTGTKYHLTGTPVFLSDLGMMIDPLYPNLVCDYYRAHKDFATNEQMQKICETKRGFSSGPILCAKATLIPFTDRFAEPGHHTWSYTDVPEKYDVEVGDTLTSFEL